MKELMALEIEPSEAAIVKTVFEKTVVEGAGTFVMEHCLNERKITSHKGSEFQTITIKRILKNPLYCAHCGMKLNATSYVDHNTTKDGVRHETPRRFRYICSVKYQ